MRFEINDDVLMLLIELVCEAQADVHETLDQFDENGERVRMGHRPAQVLSRELDRLRKLELFLKKESV